MALKNIEDYIIEDLGIPNVNMEGLDISVAYEIADALTITSIIFPSLCNAICSIGSAKYIEEQTNMVLNANPLLKPRYQEIENMGQIMTTSTIEGVFNSNHKLFLGIALHEGLYNKKIEELNKQALESTINGYHHKSCTTFKSCIYHEVGHILSRILNLNNDFKLKILIYKQIANLDEIETKVSKYALTSFEELIAEIIACYMVNPNTNELINSVGSYIEEKYQKYENSKRFRINEKYKIQDSVILSYKKEN